MDQDDYDGVMADMTDYFRFNSSTAELDSNIYYSPDAFFQYPSRGGDDYFHLFDTGNQTSQDFFHPDPVNHSLSRIYDRQRRWYFVGLAVLPVWILFGNLLVLMSVVGFRHLRTLSNWVIASLAFTDLLLAVSVVPLGIYQLVIIITSFLLSSSSSLL